MLDPPSHLTTKCMQSLGLPTFLVEAPLLEMSPLEQNQVSFAPQIQWHSNFHPYFLIAKCEFTPSSLTSKMHPLEIRFQVDAFSMIFQSQFLHFKNVSFDF